MEQVEQKTLVPTGMSVLAVANQVAMVRELLQTVMVEGKHYGTIPGTDRPSLLQPGAQLINLTFGIADKDLELVQTDLDRGHREYRIHKQGVHRSTGLVLAEAYGTCSTMESRYRWRRIGETVGDVPKSYWAVSRDDMEAKQQALVEAFGPGNYRVRKVEGVWVVQKLGDKEDREENPDIADTYNTVLSVADKRCYVRMTIKAVAASEIFTHDVDELTGDDEGGFGGGGGGGGKRKGKPKTEYQKGKEAQKKRSQEEAARQALIEKVAVTIAGEKTKAYFSDIERDTYAKEIRSGGAAGGSLPTEQLKKLVEEVETELAKRKALPPEELAKLVAGSKDSLSKAAQAGWDAAGKSSTPPAEPAEQPEEDSGQGELGIN